MLAHLVGPVHKPNSQLYSTAQSKEQAAVLFALAAKMVRMSPELRAVVSIRDTVKHLYCGMRGTIYKALSAEAKTAYGMSPIFTVHDELGQVRGPRSELYTALETAASAHEAPLTVIISTQAADDLDLLSVLIDDAKTERDPHTVLALYTADAALDPFAEETIRLANPAFGDFQNAAEVLGMADDARRMPAQENSFRNLHLNQRVLNYSPFVSQALWDANIGSPPDDFDGLDVYGGLDLAYNGDLASLVLVAKHEGVWAVKPYFWLPENNIDVRSRTEGVPYDMWVKQGLLTTTPGNSIQYEYVAAELKKIFEEYSVAAIAYDPWRWNLLRPVLEREGFGEDQFGKFQEFRQGYKTMTPAVGCLEMLLKDARIAHGGNPVLRHNAAGTVITADPSGGRKFDKRKSRGRIDGIVALAMATMAANSAGETRKLSVHDIMAAEGV